MGKRFLLIEKANPAIDEFVAKDAGKLLNIDFVYKNYVVLTEVRESGLQSFSGFFVEKKEIPPVCFSKDFNFEFELLNLPESEIYAFDVGSYIFFYYRNNEKCAGLLAEAIESVEKQFRYILNHANEWNEAKDFKKLSMVLKARSLATINFEENVNSFLYKSLKFFSKVDFVKGAGALTGTLTDTMKRKFDFEEETIRKEIEKLAPNHTTFCEFSMQRLNRLKEDNQRQIEFFNNELKSIKEIFGIK